MQKKTSKNEKPSIEDKYQKIDQKKHVLLRPGMYIGSTSLTKGKMQIFDSDKKKIIHKEIEYTPGLYKTEDEVVVNALDHNVREETCKTIKIYITKKSLKVWNDGPGIPIVVHKEHKIYIPEMIFGHLLTSTNYDDDEERVVSGTNGLGIKLCNIYSTKFEIETIDTEHSNKKYIQEFSNNMLNKTEPIITKINPKVDKSYTCVSYYPDFAKFKKTEFSDDDIAWIKKRAYDMAACAKKGTNVYFNDELIKINSFQEYIYMYYDSDPDNLDLIYQEINDRWKVGVVFSPDNGKNQVSFVNGTSTYEGGEHVDYVLNQIVDGVKDFIKTKHKLDVKDILIKEHLDIFIDSNIVNPEFPSQTKSKLSTKPSKFGSECKIPKTFMTSLLKTGLVDLVVKNAQFKEATQLKKTDGKKKGMIDIPKLLDAREAGTKNNYKCRLFLTEGDSAFSYFRAGLEIIGRDYYGGFPLRGKLLNVRNATIDKIKKNEEFIALKNIMGLKQGEKYTDVKKLRYGGIVILTDQDVDGSHIKGLIINLFQYFWPELLKIDGFIQTMTTALVRVWKKSDKKKENPIEFYSESKFDEWCKTVDIKKYDVKYYKGLGTSDNKTAKRSFVDYENKVVSFIWENPKIAYNNSESGKSESDNESSNSDSDENSSSDEESKDTKESQTKDVVKAKTKKGKKGKLELVITDPNILNSKSYDKITLAFDEERADDRKGWLSDYDRNNILTYDKQNITYSEFIDLDLKHFSNYDNIRSIPSIMDGFKPSQRKIMYICLSDNIRKDIKVIDLASEVSKRTAYKHGNVSLEETIIGMAQDFPGSNNINLLCPNGNFGNRVQGGNDRASSRYIFTFLENISQKIFLKEDDSILNYLQEDGKEVEPETFYPILPMVLVNGCSGIGTGFSTNIPKYNPIEICENLLRMLDGEELEEMNPWYSGFNGVVDKEDAKTYRVSGTFKIKNDSTLIVSEIPIVGLYCWPANYEEKILRPLAGLSSTIKEDKKDKKDKKKKEPEKKKPVVNVILKKYLDNCGNNSVEFELHFLPNEMQKLIKKGEVEDRLKLSSTISTSNMYLYNSKGIITKYNSPLEIMKEFYEKRLEIYVKRKAYHMKLLNNELEMLKYKVKYIKDVLEDKIKVAKKKRDEVIEQLVKRNYPKLCKKLDATEDEKSYDYLSSMLLWSLTQEKIDELEKEYEEKQNEYDDYNSTTEFELWRRELKQFMDAYPIWIKEREERNSDDFEKEHKSKNKSSKKKK